MPDSTAPEPSRPNLVLRNALSLLSGQFVAGVLSFFLVLLLPRFVPADALGDYFVALAVAALLGALARFGMQDPLIRQLHLLPEHASSTLGVAFGLRLTLNAVVLGACAFVIRVNGYPPDLSLYVWLLVGAEVLNGTARLLYAVFRARERMGYEAAAVLTERAIVVVVGGGLVAFGFGGMGLFCAVALGAAGLHLVLTSSLALSRFGAFRPIFSWSAWGPLVRLFLPYAVVNVLMLVYLRIDTILLREWSGLAPESIAWYGIAYSWAMSLTVFPGAVMAAAYPRIARLARVDVGETERRSFRSLYGRSWKLMLATGIPFAIGTSMCAGKISALFYSTETYPPGTMDAALRVLAWAGGLLFLSAVVSNVLRAANRWRGVIVLVGITACFNVAANVWAIPRYDHVGAAWALVLSEAIYVVGGVVAIGRGLKAVPELRFLLRLAPAWVGLVTALKWTEPLPVFAQAGVGVAVYLGLLWALKAMRRSDWTLAED